MTASVIDGRGLADQVIAKVTNETARLTTNTGIVPGIAVVIVGDDPASKTYVRSKGKKARECGFHSVIHEMPADITEKKLLALIDELNNDEAIDAILVQLPLPEHIRESEIIQAISPAKDVDGFHFINIGKLGAGVIQSAFIPCTPAGTMILLRHALDRQDFSGLNAVVVGRSNIVGKPMINLLLMAHATVTITHSRTKDLSAITRTADILVAAVGKSEMIRGDWIKPGAVVIDVGINRIPAPEKGEGKTRLIGDVAYDECAKVASAITPVPGGVGPMTIAMLMANTLTSACLRGGVEPPKVKP